MQITKP